MRARTVHLMPAPIGHLTGESVKLWRGVLIGHLPPDGPSDGRHGAASMGGLFLLGSSGHDPAFDLVVNVWRNDLPGDQLLVVLVGSSARDLYGEFHADMGKFHQLLG